MASVKERWEQGRLNAALGAAGFEARRIRSYGREQRPLPGLAFFSATRR